MVTTLVHEAVQICYAPQPVSQCLRTEWCSERCPSSGTCTVAKTLAANPAQPIHRTAISKSSRTSEKRILGFLFWLAAPNLHSIAPPSSAQLRSLSAANHTGVHMNRTAEHPFLCRLWYGSRTHTQVQKTVFTSSNGPKSDPGAHQKYQHEITLGAFWDLLIVCFFQNRDLLQCCIFFLVRFAFTRQHFKAYQNVNASHMWIKLSLARVHLFMFQDSANSVNHQDWLTRKWESRLHRNSIPATFLENWSYTTI